MRLTAYAHKRISPLIQEGDAVIDATVGNGHDTAFLAKLVGPSGRIFGFDIQKSALQATEDRLREIGCIHQTTLLHAGHETMEAHIPKTYHRQVAAVIFNLGYLPGGDKTCITYTDTTLEALDAAMRILSPGGALSIMLYPGHPGGEEEAAAVRAWALPYQPEKMTTPKGPQLLFIQKGKDKDKLGKLA